MTLGEVKSRRLRDRYSMQCWHEKNRAFFYIFVGHKSFKPITITFMTPKN